MRMQTLRFVLLASLIYVLGLALGHGLALLTGGVQQPLGSLVRLLALAAVFLWTAWAAPSRRVFAPVGLSWSALWLIYLALSGTLHGPGAGTGVLFGYLLGLVASLIGVGLLHWGLLLGLRWLMERLSRVRRP